MDTQSGLGSELRLSHERPNVVLIGFQKMGNLGLGYLSAVLRGANVNVQVLDIKSSPERMVETIRRTRPILVGFSLIFQYYIRRYGDLMRDLRSQGVDSHFTMGGHYPTLSFDQTLKAAPELDSIVRFEGEATLLELVNALASGRDWRAIDGIVWRDENEIVANAPRALAPDLDAPPFPRPRLRTDQGSRPQDHADPGKSRLRPDLLLLFHSYVLSHGAGQGGENAEARPSGARNADAARIEGHRRLSLPG